MFEGSAVGGNGSPGTGVLRLVLAVVAALLILAGWVVPGSVVVYPAVCLAALSGVLGILEKPRAFVREPLAGVLADALAVTLLVVGTGGGASPFVPLYLIASLGMVQVRGPVRAIAGSGAMVGGYLVAGYADSGSPASSIGVRVGSILAVCCVSWFIGTELRGARRAYRKLSTTIDQGRVREEKTAELVSGLSPLLELLGLEGILQWTAETSCKLVRASYAHVSIVDGNHHRTAADGKHECYPSWWHPDIQRLALWGCQENEVLRSGETICGIEGFISVPMAYASGGCLGAMVVGGVSFGAGEERILRLLALEAAPALEKASASPGGRDSVTGLPGRASLHRVLRQELAQERAVTVVMADLEHLRRYNAAYSFQAGDALLERIGARFEERQVRAFRCGGDEFAVILKGSNREKARGLARGIQQMVAELTAGSLSPLTASTGFTIARSGDPDTVLDAAASAVNEAKGGLRTGGISEPAFREARSPEMPGASVRADNGPALALVEAAEVRMPSLGVHLRAVSRLAASIGSVMGLPEEELEALVTGALLHDIGKVGIPDDILFKSGALTDGEYEIIKRHPLLGARIIQEIKSLHPALPAVKHHHERFDGTGYPDGLSGYDIPLAARIVFVADAFDSMVRDRPYRYMLPAGEALEEIVRNSGSQFDPEVVAALERVAGGLGRDLGFAN